MNHQVADLIPAAQQLAQKAAATGWEALQKTHAQAWHTIWETADIQIDGDVAAQQAIRFNIFQLNQTYSGKDARLNIGQRGLQENTAVVPTGIQRPIVCRFIWPPSRKLLHEIYCNTATISWIRRLKMPKSSGFAMGQHSIPW